MRRRPSEVVETGSGAPVSGKIPQVFSTKAFFPDDHSTL
jgi:hypothetical protein